MSWFFQTPHSTSPKLIGKIFDHCDGAQQGGAAFAFASAMGVKLLGSQPTFSKFLETSEFTMIVGLDAITDTKAVDELRQLSQLYPNAYLGSGTTAAVAHKMGRNYIGIEVGEHAATHCVERMRQVIAGESGGVSSDLNWSGGGAFRFFKLCNADAAPLIDVSKRVGVIAASRRKKSLENKIDADPLRTRAF